MSMIDSAGVCGVRIVATGSAVPDRVLTNADLEKMLDTSDEWIQQRTGIRERRVIDPSRGEGNLSLATDAIRAALNAANMKGSDLDLLIMGTVTSEMTCPSNACRIAAAIDMAPAPAFDLMAACCGFAYSICTADSLIRSGRFRTVGVIGCDAMSTAVDYTDRSVSILFGDAAGAAILTADDDKGRGCFYQRLYADGNRWTSLYIPRRDKEVPEEDKGNPIRLGNLRMNGREVYKFAVTKFLGVMQDALIDTGLSVDDISQFICHQSNARMIESAIEKLSLPPEKVYINIDRYGNSSSGSVGLCLDQIWKAGKIKTGDIIMLVAFGGGMTWTASLWRI